MTYKPSYHTVPYLPLHTHHLSVDPASLPELRTSSNEPDMNQTTVMQMVELYLNLSYMNHSWPLFTGNESDLSTNEIHATNSLRSHRQAINTESIYLLGLLGANDEQNHCWMMDMSYRQSTTCSLLVYPR